jgi:hypothetical protein
MKLYDMMRIPIVCPYCGNTFDDNDFKVRKKGITAEEPPKIDFDLENDVSSDDPSILCEDDVDGDLDMLKIKELE